MQKVLSSKYFFIASLVLVHALFFLFALHSGNIYLHNDSDEYLQQAENIQKHHSWYAGDWNKPVNNYLVSRRPPLAGLFILTTKSIFNSDYAVCFFQCLLSIFNLLLVTKIIRFFLPLWNIYSLFLALLLFFPTQFIYANMIMMEVLFQTTLLCGFYFLVRFFDSKKTVHFLLFHVFITAAVLVKPVLYLFWVPLLIFMIWMLYKKIIKPFQLSFILIFISVVFLVSLRNYTQTGYFHYSSVNENYIVNYSVYLTIADKEKGEEAGKKIKGMITEARTKANYHDYSVFIRARSMEIIRDNLSSFLMLQLKGITNFFIDHGRWGIYAFFDKQPQETTRGWKYFYEQDGIGGAINYLKQFYLPLLFYLLIEYVINSIITLSFFLFLFDKKLDPAVRITVFIFVFYIAAVTGMIGSARFRMAVYPFLLFAFPFGWKKIKLIFKKLNSKTMFS